MFFIGIDLSGPSNTKDTALAAFEDSPNGVAAAKAAGVLCIAVPGPMTRHLSLVNQYGLCLS